jgi:flagella basal body P-ring formation protein FlgA
VIGPEDFRAEVREESFFSAVPETNPQRVSGKLSRRTIPAGAALTDELLVAPRDVNPGEAVEVQVRSGSAHLKFDARALTGGRDGERILLLNPATGKKFKAVIAGKSRAVVSVEDSDDENPSRGTLGLPAPRPRSATPGGKATARQGESEAGPAQATRPPDSGS